MGLRKFIRTVRRFGLAAALDGAGADRLDADYVSDASPIVVGGCGRSGTTLLRVMLDSHRDICCGPESELLLPASVRLDVLAERFDLTPKTIAKLYVDAGSRAQFVEQFFAEYCRSVGKARWAEKSPRNVMNLDWIFAAFPTARFLHVIRDGRDVACSLRTHPRHKLVDGELVPLNTWHPIDQCIQRWVDALDAARAWRYEPRCMDVKYEDLVETPAETLRQICDFVGVDWDEGMLDYHRVESSSRDVKNFPQNPEATRKIDSKSLARWQRDFSDEDRAVFKQMAGDLLIQLGYEQSNDW